MKKIIFTLLCTIALFTFRTQAFTLEDITSGKFLPQDVAETYPSTDGVHYYAATNGNTRIVKCEYRTGHEVDTLFDVKTARECNLKSFDGFSLSPDEKHLLIYADSEPIYRRSFKANYYTFEIRRNLLKPLSEGGKTFIAITSMTAKGQSKIRPVLTPGAGVVTTRAQAQYVVTENGNVYLMGIVTKDESARAINTVLKISGVRRVYHIFDYIEEQKYQGNGANDEENILVSPQKRGQNNYNKPVRSSNYQDYSNSDGTYAPQQRYGSYEPSSTYVPPVQQQQNGGAYIMDEPAPQPTSGPASLLVPADQY